MSSRNFLCLIIPIMAFGCGSPQRQGEALYTLYCSSCHMEDGSGLQSLIPPLAGADYIIHNADKLPCIIQNGLKGPILVNGKEYNQVMLPIAGLNDVEMANILNFIQKKWGDPAIFYSPEAIRQALSSCQ